MRHHLIMNSRNEDGYVTILILILLAVITTVGSSIVDSQLLTNRIMRKGRIETLSYNVQQQIIASIYNDAAWTTQTASNNQCMLNGTNCAGINSAAALILKDQNGNIINDSTSATDGYDSSGNRCTQYNSQNGNPSCPFHFDLTWQPISCVAGQCIIQVSGIFSYNPGANSGSAIVMNPTRFNFTINRTREQNSLREACQSMIGNFQQGMDSCTISPTQTVDCPAGQYMVRGQNNGQLFCQPSMSSAMNCPDGSAAIGFTANGELNCVSVLDN